MDATLRESLWKASMLLCGSILEGVLLDVLDRRRDLAGPYLKRRRFPDEASLEDMVKIAGDLELVGNGKALLSSTACQASIAVKDHRDLIHPQSQLRQRIPVDRAAAELMLLLLRLVLRDLQRAADDGLIGEYEGK